MVIFNHINKNRYFIQKDFSYRC